MRVQSEGYVPCALCGVGHVDRESLQELRCPGKAAPSMAS